MTTSLPQLVSHQQHHKRLTIDEKKNMVNTFYIRFDVASGEEFLFNVYTGETILTEDSAHTQVDRYVSLWRKREPPTKGNQKLMRLPEMHFKSRVGIGAHKNRWNHHEGISEEFASILISSAYRGFKIRRMVYELVCERFRGHMDKDSGYVYFFDSVSATTSWHKPKLCCGSLFLLTSSPNRKKANVSRKDDDPMQRTFGALTPRGFPRMHRTADGRIDETGYRISYSFSPDLGFKNRKLRFVAEQREKMGPDGRNDKWASSTNV